MRRSLPWLTTLSLAAACTPADRLEIRFASSGQRAATTEMRVFLFGGADAPTPGCARLDPRGLGPGDAPTRTGLTPTFEQIGPLQDLVAELPDVPKGEYSVVIEAWGPACEEVRSGADEPTCARLAASGPSVLRAYYCNDLDLGARQLDGAADLESFADVGAEMRVPADGKRYDEAAPLLVADGLPGRDRFLVQLLAGNGDERDDVKVRFSVESGEAGLVQAQPAVTAVDELIQDQGLASVVLRANGFASSSEDPRIVVTAYAPGFEGAPIRFHARALPNVTAQVTAHVVPPPRASMAGVDERAVPIALDDLDGDGRLDVVTVAGRSDHQLIVHYGGATDVHVSAVRGLQARALTVARLTPGVPSVIVSAAQRSSDRREETVHGNTYVIENPQLEIWGGLDTRPSQGTLTDPQAVLTSLDGQPIDKVTIAMSAKDLDDDGVDELAFTRCSYLFLTDAGQNRFVRCLGRVIDKTDSEIAILTAAPGPDLTVKAIVPGQDNEGGFREVDFADVNGDNSFDLVLASNSEVHGTCGRRFQGAIGFGFDGAETFDTTITFGAGYAVAAGRFDDDDFDDVVVTGAIRAGSTVSGFKVVGGGACDGFDPGPPPLVTGSKTGAHMLSVRAADVNQDGRDDVLLLHRNTRVLQVFLGGGDLDFAAGPEIQLPTGFLGGLAVGMEGGEVVAATVSPSDNALYRIRFSPR